MTNKEGKKDTLDGQVEEMGVVEIEVYGKTGKPVPKAKHYMIRIDKIKYTVNVAQMSGRDLLVLAGKQPPERWTIQQKMHGGGAKTIGLDEQADFTAPGVERFMTLPLDQTEG